jgi:hypothetical protein
MNKLYIYGFIALVIAGFLTAFYTRGLQIENLEKEVEQKENENVIIKDTMEVKQFESNQTIEYLKTKAKKNEEINTSIGTHTIVL